jgi:hypothetical protein
MNLTEALKSQIPDLYNDTPENVHSVGLGYKFVNNQRTNEIGIVFSVYKKKPLSELNPDEILPSSVNIGGNSYTTDVIEQSTLPSGIECYSRSPLDSEINRLRGNPAFLYPIKGGQEIYQFPTGATSSVVGGQTQWSFTVGTLGFLAIDNVDNNIIGITNAHVVCNNPFLASDRIKNQETNDPYNIYEERAWPPIPSISGAPGSLCNDTSTGGLFLSGPRIKRYSSFRKTLGNTVDCAVLFLDNNIVTNQSFAIHKPSTLPQMTSKLPFATTLEIDNLLSDNNRLYSTGRTTGPKGWEETVSCRLIPYLVGASSSVSMNSHVITFNNIVYFIYEDGGDYPIVPGDSGSAVIADIGGVLKIVGLVFAAGTNFALFCRIDEIADQMNIRAWDNSYTFNTGSPCGNPYTSTTGTPPTNAVLSRIAVCDFDDPRSAQDTVIINGITYYQAGCTKNNSYSHIDSL